MRTIVIDNFIITEHDVAEDHIVWCITKDASDVAYVHLLSGKRIYYTLRGSNFSYNDAVKVLNIICSQYEKLWIEIKPRNKTLIHIVKEAGFKEQRVMNRKKKSKYFLFAYTRA